MKNTIIDRDTAAMATPATFARLRSVSVPAGASIVDLQSTGNWRSNGAGAPDQRHVCGRSSVFINNNSIGSAAAGRIMSGPTAKATKYAAPPRGVPR